ncbi:2-C-methyl-D-erythritol 4-phosphate cytidylyltransferase [Thermomonospora echinospora]|uniref:2-C-methyl-D-erythritol 4-phosphate cytidylyltransferase n=1 Tax=Thermomonospora echinospora TaxID=1992 RepID=A0A1H6DZZ1_9ACTN|nr:2-C-methyl-D-erythritol 4-phosphate cytidylyltransferase [Thermomonospora echinospora]SEG90857.1 2-C-methyl-D-erythritol 4-phosphate cytidylyltransferase [Thermomonospora echinospora]
MRTVAVVLAGGTGRRIGSATPKQLLEVGGRPILAYAIGAFDGHRGVDEVLVVMARGHVPQATRIVSEHGYGKVSRVVEGGDTRAESTVAALTALAAEPDDTRLLLHDAARPFVTAEVIDRCLAALESHQAVAVGVATPDTVVAVRDGLVAAMPPRDSLCRFQTPQCFRIGTLRKAYEAALADPAFTATDDCGVVHRYLPDVPIRVVEGDERNLKVTHPLDLVVAEHLAGLAGPGLPPDPEEA